MAYICKLNYCKECDGCMACQEDREYFCPICGEKVIETVYVDNNGNVIGCENCVETKEHGEMLEYEID